MSFYFLFLNKTILSKTMSKPLKISLTHILHKTNWLCLILKQKRILNRCLQISFQLTEIQQINFLNINNYLLINSKIKNHVFSPFFISTFSDFYFLDNFFFWCSNVTILSQDVSVTCSFTNVKALWTHLFHAHLIYIFHFFVFSLYLSIFWKFKSSCIYVINFW